MHAKSNNTGQLAYAETYLVIVILMLKFSGAIFNGILTGKIVNTEVGCNLSIFLYGSVMGTNSSCILQQYVFQL